MVICDCGESFGVFDYEGHKLYVFPISIWCVRHLVAVLTPPTWRFGDGF